MWPRKPSLRDMLDPRFQDTDGLVEGRNVRGDPAFDHECRTVRLEESIRPANCIPSAIEIEFATWILDEFGKALGALRDESVFRWQ